MNTLPKKTKTIGLSCPLPMAKALEERAAGMGMSTSKFCTTILSQWLESGKKLVLTEGE